MLFMSKKDRAICLKLRSLLMKRLKFMGFSKEQEDVKE